MGPGGSPDPRYTTQEAPFPLVASIPAGTYHLVLDAIITTPVDVTFDLVWRTASGDNTLAHWGPIHYVPTVDGQYKAQPFSYDEDCGAIDFTPGDELVFRYTGANGTAFESYIPNGDGSFKNGEIPNITLPAP